MQKEKTLLFRGSKDRLKRNISRAGGILLENQRFEILWRSKYFRRGLSYRIRGRYEKSEEGYHITYTLRPAAVTVFWVGIPVLLLLVCALLECLAGSCESAAAEALFSLIYPSVAVWQRNSCHKAFREFFLVATK